MSIATFAEDSGSTSKETLSRSCRICVHCSGDAIVAVLRAQLVIRHQIRRVAAWIAVDRRLVWHRRVVDLVVATELELLAAAGIDHLDVGVVGSHYIDECTAQPQHAHLRDVPRSRRAEHRGAESYSRRHLAEAAVLPKCGSGPPILYFAITCAPREGEVNPIGTGLGSWAPLAQPLYSIDSIDVRAVSEQFSVRTSAFTWYASAHLKLVGGDAHHFSEGAPSQRTTLPIPGTVSAVHVCRRCL